MAKGERLRALAMSAIALGGLLTVIGVSDGGPARAATVSVPAIVRDFDHDPKVNAPNAHPDFEAFTGDDPDIVTQRLGNDGKPVYGDHPTGTATTTGKAAFDQWFRDVATVNRTVPITLDFDVTGSATTFNGNNFFPIDGKGWNDASFGNAGQVDDGHNFSFTMEIHTTFVYQTGQEFTFEGDDDVFVYFNGYLGIDLGGVHPSETQSVQLDDIAPADRANMTAGNTYPLDIFFAERHTTDSNFNIDANFAMAPAQAPTTTTTTTTSTTSTTGATTTTTRPATTTTVAASRIARTGGSGFGPWTAVGVTLLCLGTVAAMVDRRRYRGQHYL